MVAERRRNPLVPFSIFEIEGLVATDITQVIAQAGFYSMFFFVTLYMQSVLGFSPIAALITTSSTLGGALGLAIFSAIATGRTQDLLAVHASRAAALTSGFQHALIVCSVFLVAAAAIATRATSTRGAAAPVPQPTEPAPVPVPDAA